MDEQNRDLLILIVDDTPRNLQVLGTMGIFQQRYVDSHRCLFGSAFSPLFPPIPFSYPFRLIKGRTGLPSAFQ